jgi:hypothetical protein
VKKKAILVLSISFVVLMAAVFIRKLLNGDSSSWLDTLGRILVSVLPISLLFLKKIPFSLSLIISYYLLLFCTFFLGAVLKFYDRFHWWDTTLHFFGSAFMAFIGVTIYTLFILEPTKKDISRWMIFTFVLSFAVTGSVLWESAEFVGAVTGILQKDSNTDTMTDLLAGMAGGFLVAVYTGLQKKTNDRNTMDRDTGR